jgi:diadenosine tetraphosphatase ApaH/serine/threonine PP2A family protein phosphatase
MKVDIIGDVHGCLKELEQLFDMLGYKRKEGIFVHPDGRIPVFLGDITDRGPASVPVIRLVYDMVISHKKAKYVPGNHCNKLYRYFSGNKVQQKNGLETTVAELQALDHAARSRVSRQFTFLYRQAPLYQVLPEVNAVVAHAGIKESLIGRTDKKVKSFVLYGDTTGETLPDGRPVRRDWAQHYHGDRWIVYGHTPVMTPRQVNKTMNIDTGCVFGGKLTAFRLPEEELISVPSGQPLTEEKFAHFD